MALPPIYSRRKRQINHEQPDVFVYDNVPTDLRISLFKTMNRTVQSYGQNAPNEIWSRVKDAMCEELGVYRLAQMSNYDTWQEVETYFSHLAPTENVLDIIELWVAFTNAKVQADRFASIAKLREGIEMLNARLLERGLGFALINGQIIEKSNEFLHNDVVLPALRVLSDHKFSGANEEFHAAHQAYRNGDYKNCIVDCLKSFESVIKIIAHEKNWIIPDNPNAKTLIKVLFENSFLPGYMESQLTSLRGLMESSVPTTRNRAAGHGQGPHKIEVSKSLAAFQLHQTAAIIVFLSDI